MDVALIFIAQKDKNVMVKCKLGQKQPLLILLCLSANICKDDTLTKSIYRIYA